LPKEIETGSLPRVRSRAAPSGGDGGQWLHFDQQPENNQDLANTQHQQLISNM
jgi:hypothetical protein